MPRSGRADKRSASAARFHAPAIGGCALRAYPPYCLHASRRMPRSGRADKRSASAVVFMAASCGGCALRAYPPYWPHASRRMPRSGRADTRSASAVGIMAASCGGCTLRAYPPYWPHASPRMPRSGRADTRSASASQAGCASASRIGWGGRFHVALQGYQVTHIHAAGAGIEILVGLALEFIQVEHRVLATRAVGRVDGQVSSRTDA